MTQNRESENPRFLPMGQQWRASLIHAEFTEAFELEVLITAEGEGGNEYTESVCKEELHPQPCLRPAPHTHPVETQEYSLEQLPTGNEGREQHWSEKRI